MELPSTYGTTPASDSFTLDALPPTHSIEIPGAANDITSSRPRGGASASDPTNPEFFYDLVDKPFDADRAPDMRYNPGFAEVVKANGRSRFELRPGGDIAGSVVGEKLGGGGISTAYKIPGDPDNVIKSVDLGSTADPTTMAIRAKAVLDQETSYQILLKLEQTDAGDGLFRIARRKTDPVLVETSSGTGETRRMAVTVEENIASEVRLHDGTRLLDADGNPVLVTNADDRLRARGDVALNEAERLTLNIAVRRLNRRGIVWTDQKLPNIDIVPNQKSPTGYQAVFFDLDGFRLIKSSTPMGRYELARPFQEAFDHSSTSRGMLKKLNEAAIRQGSTISESFDFGPYNGTEMSLPFTANVNRSRTDYNDLNELDLDAFEATVILFNTRTGRNGFSIASTVMPIDRAVAARGFVPGAQLTRRMHCRREVVFATRSR